MLDVWQFYPEDHSDIMNVIKQGGLKGCFLCVL